MKVMLVDDNVDMVDVTTYSLRKNGYEVVVVTDGVQAVQSWEDERPDLILLDVGLPRLNGYEVCRRIRETSNVPVIMLTARAEDDNVAQGFLAGADDYVIKPFSHRQLSLRIRAVLNRCSGGIGAEPSGELTTRYLRLNLRSHEVTRGDKTVRLTPLEFRILYVLAANEGTVVSSNRLVEYAWSYDGGEAALLKTHICHIRQKLGMEAEGETNILSIPWVGYILTRN